HALIDLGSRRDEERAALLEVEARVRGDGAGSVGHQGAPRTSAHLARPRLVPVEDVVEQAGAPRLGEELRPETDEPASRDEVVEPDPPGAVVDHLLQPAAPQAE